jgi:hypothetical protein
MRNDAVSQTAHRVNKEHFEAAIDRPVRRPHQIPEQAKFTRHQRNLSVCVFDVQSSKFIFNSP